MLNEYIKTMKVIKINERNEVYCGVDEANLNKCDVVGLYHVCGECGGCPIIQLHEDLLEISFEGAIERLDNNQTEHDDESNRDSKVSNQAR